MPYYSSPLLVPYYFGLYHWRRRLRAALGGLAMAFAGGVLFDRTDGRAERLLSVAVVAVGAARVARAVSALLSPPPWVIERYKYDALAGALPLAETDRLLDVGCGTGRSIVGLAPHVPGSTTVVGLDVFDDRVILGNGPRLAERNGRIAGVTVDAVRGDAARLPLSEATFDVVTACRVLHDLPADRHDAALAALRRVCSDDGRLGILELPIVPDHVDRSAPRYWRDRVVAAGFAIRTVERVERRDDGDPYVVLVATPDR